MHKVGIMVFMLPDNICRKIQLLLIWAYFHIKAKIVVIFRHSSPPNEYKYRYCDKVYQMHDFDIFLLKILILDNESLFVTLWGQKNIQRVTKKKVCLGFDKQGSLRQSVTKNFAKNELGPFNTSLPFHVHFDMILQACFHWGWM